MLKAGHSFTGVRTIEDCLGQIYRSVAFRSAFMQSSGNGDSPGIVPTLQRPLADAVALFTRLRIPYALVGGIAAMVYGRSRFTEDIDFVAAGRHQDILAANPDVMREFHFDPASTWKLYHETGVEIDIWKDEFSDDIASRAREVQFGAGEKLKIADPHDLIAMKLRAGRLQDDYDISEIVKRTPIDESVLQLRVNAGQFAHYQSVKSRITS